MNKHSIKLLFTAIIGFLIIASFTHAKVAVSINDTLIKRGMANFVPVYLSLDEQVSTVKLKLKFNKNMLHIDSAYGGDNMILGSDGLAYTSGFDNTEFGYFEIESSNINSISSGILCMVSLEGLAYSDSISSLEPIEIYLNGKLSQEAELNTATITVTGLSIFPGLKESLGLNYPNPFPYKTIFQFNIDRKSTVEFRVYDNIGMFISSSSDRDPAFKILRKTENGDILIEDNEQELIPGNYLLDYWPNLDEVSQGMYIMMMETKSGVYSRLFIRVD